MCPPLIVRSRFSPCWSKLKWAGAHFNSDLTALRPVTRSSSPKKLSRQNSKVSLSHLFSELFFFFWNLRSIKAILQNSAKQKPLSIRTSKYLCRPLFFPYSEYPNTKTGLKILPLWDPSNRHSRNYSRKMYHHSTFPFLS